MSFQTNYYYWFTYLGIPRPRGKARAVRVEVDGVDGRFLLPALTEQTKGETRGGKDLCVRIRAS